jgi:hypothetical protein
VFSFVVFGTAAVVVWNRHPSPGPVDVRPIVLVASGDTGGWIVPCGCTTNQSGGLPRRGTYLRSLPSDAHIIYVDVGGAPGGTSDYHRAKFEAILKGERLMNVAAHNIGGPEAALGPDYLFDMMVKFNVTKGIQMPLVSANAFQGVGGFLQPQRIIEVGGRRICITGVLSQRYSAKGFQIGDPRENLLAIASKRKQDFDVLVVLAYMPEDELRSLAATVPEIDVLVGGPTGQAIPPQPAGPTTLAAATNKGKFLVQLQPDGSRWSGSVVELDKSFADDPEQLANVKAYLDVLADRDFTAAETGFAPPMPPNLPPDYRVAGSDSCKGCHQADCQSWAASKHAHAWETLTAKGYHVDGYCQQCHTTGFGLPGGFVSAKRSADRFGVGCESCHGPSEGHVKNPKVRTPFAARDQCVRCHDHENSPTFEYGPYWEKIKHGAKVKNSLTPRPPLP